jgi:DNA-binding transcriptional LysR family regulator
MIYSVCNTFENLSALPYKKIEDIPIYVAMSEKHPFASAETLPLDRLGEEDFYFISSAGAERYLAQCRQAGFTPKRIVLLHNYPSVIMAVRQGKGMTLCGIDVKYTYGSDIRFLRSPTCATGRRWCWRGVPKTCLPKRATLLRSSPDDGPEIPDVIITPA